MKTAAQHNQPQTGHYEFREYDDASPLIEKIRRQKRGDRFGKQRVTRRKRH